MQRLEGKTTVAMRAAQGVENDRNMQTKHQKAAPPTHQSRHTMKIMMAERKFSQQLCLWSERDAQHTHSLSLKKDAATSREGAGTLGRWMMKLFVSHLWQGAGKRQKTFPLWLSSSSVLCVPISLLVRGAWWPFSVFNIFRTACKYGLVCGRADICTCAEHFDFMTLLFASLLVSAWFIQWLMWLQPTGLACNDLSCHRKTFGEENQEMINKPG